MTDFVFVKSSSGIKASNLEKILEHFSGIYHNPIIKKFQKENITAISISRKGSSQFINSLYSKDLRKYIWITGIVFLDQEKMNDESFLAFFEKKGIHGLKQLSGWFNIIVYSLGSGQVEVVNSRLGLDILYYSRIGREVFISTRLSSFNFLLPNISFDQGVILQQSLYNYPFTRNTIFKSVKMLPSSSVIRFSVEDEFIEKYWKPGEEIINKPLNFKRSLDVLDNGLDKAVKKLINGHSKIALSLTGGWDGRLLLAYVLKHKPKEQIKLYSFGIESSEDIFVPLQVSEKFGYDYMPVILSDDYVKNDFLNWAAKTTLYSDSLRSIKRAHYLFTMNIISPFSEVVLSGNGGSNLLKSSAYAPCNVFNRFVLGLIRADNPEKEIGKHFDYLKSNFPEVLNGLSRVEFKDSFYWAELKDLYSIKNTNVRFTSYLLSDIEKKYFGAEQTSYKHLVDNYSPFFDYDFIQELMKTSFFGGFSNDSKSIAVVKNSLLYAKLINRNNKDLASEPTDRGFALNELLNPLNYGKLGFTLLRKKFNKKPPAVSHYNTDSALVNFIDSYNLPLKKITGLEKINKEFVANYISIKWFLDRMNDLN
ncbi:MAG: hypothetical protein K9G76_00260 [Bacteroidales bacterium]|nr:hypothetical protein [Bacteroidales bacterium]MCF8402544.1 hypothetical protein [Bacteroidales bacterium]